LGGWKMSMNDAARRAPPRVLRGTEQALRNVLMKKPFAWVSKGALGTKLARPGAQGCLP